MRILVVDDHDLYRAGLESLLTAWGQDVVGTAADGQGALEQARALRPDMILMDVNLPVVSGIEATRLIKAELPATRVVAISAYDDPDYVARALAGGAEGYVLKSMPDDQLRAFLVDPARSERPQLVHPRTATHQTE